MPSGSFQPDALSFFEGAGVGRRGPVQNQGGQIDFKPRNGTAGRQGLALWPAARQERKTSYLAPSFLFPDHVTHRLFFHFILFTYLFLIVFILKVFKMVENCFPEQMHVAEGRTGQHRGHSV